MSLASRARARKIAQERFDHEAAAEARALAADARAAEDVADDGAALEAATDPASPPVRRGSLAQRRMQRLAARAAGDAAANDNDETAPEREPTNAYAQMQLQLAQDRHRLKAIQSREKKIELKRELLPAYDAWVAGVLEAVADGGRGVQDDVFATVMIWRIDVGDFAGAMPLIEYVLRWNVALPGNIARTPATFVVEEIATAAIAAYSAGGDVAAAFPAEILGAIDELTEDEDMHDEVRAKLFRALGMAILAPDTSDETESRVRQEVALRHYRRAIELHDRVGVKKDVERLERDLKKGEGGIDPARLEEIAAGLGQTAEGLAAALAGGAQSNTANPEEQSGNA